MKWNLIGSAGRQPAQIQRIILTIGTLILLLAPLLSHTSAFARYEARRAYQESPLSPVATPITAALPANLTTTLTSTLTSTQTAILTETTATTLTTVFTSPLAAPSTATQTTSLSRPTTVTVPLPVATAPAPTAELVNRGQTSLLLVGAVLGGILVVIVVVLGRQR